MAAFNDRTYCLSAPWAEQAFKDLQLGQPRARDGEPGEVLHRGRILSGNRTLLERIADMPYGGGAKVELIRVEVA